MRCSRCKHAFFVARPGSRRADAIDEVVAEVTGAGGAPVPEVAQDLSSPKGAAPELRRDAKPTGQSAEDGGSGDFEEDWEFNDESPPEIPGDEERGLPGIGEFDATALDLTGEPSEPEIAAGGAVALDLGGGSSEPELAAAGVESIEAPASDSSAAEEPSIDPIESIRARDAGLDSSSADELGSPEDWNFVGASEGEFPIEPAPERDVPEAVAPSVEKAGSAPRAPLPSDSRSAGTAPDGESAGFSLPARLASLASIAAWILVFLGFAAGMSTVLTPPGEQGAVQGRSAEIEVPGLAITAIGVEDRIVENALAGNLLVVSGTLENGGEEVLTPGRSVWVQLVSETGMPISGAKAAAGRALSESRLREQEPAGLRLDLERSAEDIALQSLRPGERVRFDAVFESIPESATGWVLQAASSPPRRDPTSSLPPIAPLSWE